MATPQWIQNIGNTLRDTVLPVALGVVGGGVLTRLLPGQQPAAAPAQTAAAPTVQRSSITATAQDAGLMEMKIAGVPIILVGLVVVAYLAFRKG